MFWYHGDAVKRTTFADQKWDRDADRDPNAQGPGIYWTSDHQQARGYAYPTGYVYTAKIKGNFVTDTTPSDKQFLRKLIALCPDREYGLSNWDENPSRALRKAVDAYGLELFMDGALAIYYEFFRKDSPEWIAAMVALGVDGFLHTLNSVQHLIVYNPDNIQVTKEEHYSQVDKEALAPSWMHEAQKEMRQMTNLKKAVQLIGAAGTITWVEENEDLPLGWHNSLSGTVDEDNVEFRIDTRPIPSLPRQRSPGLPADIYRVGVRTVGQREWTYIDETYSLEEAKQVAEEYFVVEILNS